MLPDEVKASRPIFRNCILLPFVSTSTTQVQLQIVLHCYSSKILPRISSTYTDIWQRVPSLTCGNIVIDSLHRYCGVWNRGCLLVRHNPFYTPIHLEKLIGRSTKTQSIGNNGSFKSDKQYFWINPKYMVNIKY